MGIEYEKRRARLTDFVSVEDAEGLLAWLQAHPKGTVDLHACTHLHAANLQVLMVAKPTVSAWPQDASLADWLRDAMNKPQGV
ncbi:MAG TPA: hypothetical protein VFW68_00350 [Rhodocyclaceae bacterium]|nr:hypothetical protein [Rhodocyclaceae bacterium]